MTSERFQKLTEAMPPGSVITADDLIDRSEQQKRKETKPMNTNTERDWK